MTGILKKSLLALALVATWLMIWETAYRLFGQDSVGFPAPLSVLEAFRDGVLQPTEARYAAVLQALGEVDVLLDEMPDGSIVTQAGSESQTIDVCAVITNEVLGLEASAREHGIAFSVRQCEHKHADCKSFDGDPMRVAEIVNNVVSNAIRYTPAGGHIEIDCRRSDGSLVLAVTDDGPGISSDDAARIFEHGYRGAAAKDHAGSGLGLTLTKRFVEEHGGTIDVHNVPGKGACFTVQLPGMLSLAALVPQTDGLISLL